MIRSSSHSEEVETTGQTVYIGGPEAHQGTREGISEACQLEATRGYLDKAVVLVYGVASWS